MSDRVDTVVVGAGVVGLAVARALALRGRDVLVLERHRHAAQETSSRNSGVIHSGIYYPQGSLKARLCVRGRSMLYEYCEDRGVAHQRCGKLIVAQASQHAGLMALRSKALLNGVDDLQLLDATGVRELESVVCCETGLFSPSTGIVDVHELVLALMADLERAGGTIAFGTDVRSIDLGSSDIGMEVVSGGDSAAISCASLVNAAGLSAVDMVDRMRAYPPQHRHVAYFAKGNYFALHGTRPFRHLVYPMPNEAGLGIHATLELDGATRFGPNVEWVDAPEYSVDERHAAEFYDSIRTYWPGLPDGALQPAFAGVRPKLVGAGNAAADFVIEGAAVHGRAGLVNLLGIESPGLTSCLAIGEHVAGLI